MNNKNQVGPGFFVVLLVTFLVLVTLIASLFVVMSNDGDIVDNSPETEDTHEQKNPPKDTSAIEVGVNNAPLFPTNPRRTSYDIGTSSEVKTLSEEIKSNNTILVELDSYTSIVEKSADEKMYPASMTKVMTLLVACERVTDLQKKLVVTQEIADYSEKNDGSGAGLKVGESYSIEDLLYLVSYKSDTIASILIAEEIAGSEAAFVTLMNEKAAEIGLKGTNFVNCTGLYNENHYSTCRDIAMIMAYTMDNELAYKCLSSYRGRPMVVGGVDCTFYSTWYSGKSRFADNPNLKTSTVVAAKTGYTDESGVTLVSVAKGDNGKTYINVIVGCPKGSGLTETMSTQEVKYIYNTYIPK